jgi:hypothetical protein
MAISRKGKRAIVVQGQTFYWYVGRDSYDRFAKALQITSPNKSLVLVYRLKPITEGSSFPKLQVLQSDRIARGCYQYRQDVHDEIVTPKLVSEIIQFVCDGFDWLCRSRGNSCSRRGDGFTMTAPACRYCLRQAIDLLPIQFRYDDLVGVKAKPLNLPYRESSLES